MSQHKVTHTHQAKLGKQAINPPLPETEEKHNVVSSQSFTAILEISKMAHQRQAENTSPEGNITDIMSSPQQPETDKCCNLVLLM